MSQIDIRKGKPSELSEPKTKIKKTYWKLRKLNTSETGIYICPSYFSYLLQYYQESSCFLETEGYSTVYE